MKIKTKLATAIMSLVLVLGLLAVGVYALDKAEVNLGGNLTFSASGVYAKVTGVVSGAVEDVEDKTVTFDNGSADAPVNWNEDLSFDGAEEITYTITVENLATDRPIYVSINDTVGIQENVVKSIANGAFVLEGGGSDTITITMHIANVNLSIEDATYGYKVELMDESAIPETNPDEEYYGLYFSEYTVVGYGEWFWENEITDIVIPAYHKENGVVYPITTIGEYFIEDDDSITSVILPQTLTTIEDNALASARAITQLIIPAGVESIGENNYFGYGLTGVMVDENNDYYDSRNNCNALIEKATNILMVGCYKTVIPTSVTSIGDRAFSSCKNLTSITISDSVTSIGDGAFYYCINLTSITIPDSVTSIGEWAFDSCESLTDVYYNGTEEEWGQIEIGEDNEPLLNANIHFKGENETEIVNDYEYYYNEKHLDFDFYPTESGEVSAQSEVQNTASVKGVYDEENDEFLVSGDVVVPEKVRKDGVIYTVTAVAEGGFSNYNSDIGAYNMTSIVLPNSIEIIGNYAFYMCHGLSGQFNIPEHVTIIGDSVFAECNFVTITIPDSIETIGEEVFNDCSNLVEICNKSNIPNEEIEKPNEDTRIYSEGESSVTEDENGYVFYYNETDSKYYLVGYNGEETDLTLPDTFNGYNYDIRRYAFRNCNGLKSVTIGNGVTSIGEHAFSGCDSLASVIIGNSVTSISDCAFWGCSGLESITIPDSVQTIGDWAFYGCNALTDVYYTGSEEQWNDITIGIVGNDNLVNATKHFNHVVA